MGKNKKNSKANHTRGTLPNEAIAAVSPAESADAVTEDPGTASDDAEVPADSPEAPAETEKPADSPEKSMPETSDPEKEKTPADAKKQEAEACSVTESGDLAGDPEPGFEVRFEHGYCDICEKEVEFRIDGEFLRNHFICTECKSLPRQRAFLHVLKMCRPDWRTACLHESSPGGPSSDYLFQNAQNYSISHYYPELPSGTKGPEGVICEDLEKMSYPDNVFDVFITQDVMEHIFDISAAFNEVKRVLRPGGFFLFTVPYYKDLPKSFCRAKRLENGSIRYLTKPVYHGNPVDDKGALVTWDYGRDFPDLVARLCGLHPVICRVESRYHGLDGEMMEVFLMRKPRKKTDPADSMPPAFVFPDIPSEGEPFMTPFMDIRSAEEEEKAEEPAVAEEPAAAEVEEPVVQEAAAQEEAAVAEEPVAAEESAASEEPAVADAPVAPEEADEPESADAGPVSAEERPQ